MYTNDDVYLPISQQYDRIFISDKTEKNPEKNLIQEKKRVNSELQIATNTVPKKIEMPGIQSFHDKLKQKALGLKVSLEKPLFLPKVSTQEKISSASAILSVRSFYIIHIGSNEIGRAHV